MSKKNEAQKLQEELTWSAPHIAKGSAGAEGKGI